MWSKIDDGLCMSPEALDAGLEALGLWALAESWCGQNLTDGFISQAAIVRLAGNAATARRLTSDLVRARLWTLEEGGARSTDYTVRNPPREVVEAAREKEKKRKAAWRNKKLGLLSQGDTERDETGDETGDSVFTRPDPTRPDPLPPEEITSGEEEPQGSFALEQPKGKPKKPPAVDPAVVAKAITYYGDRWMHYYRPPDGQRPIVTKADRGQLVQQLKTLGVSKWCEALEHFLRDADPYLQREGHPIALLTRRVNAYRGKRLAAPASNGLHHPQGAEGRIAEIRANSAGWKEGEKPDVAGFLEKFR